MKQSKRMILSIFWLILGISLFECSYGGTFG